MTAFDPRDDAFEARVRDSFSRGAILKVLGTEMAECRPGFVALHQPITPVTLQHHGYVHGGVISTLMDISGGHAAQTLMATTDSVLTVEFKINMLAPGEGDSVRAEGQVIRSGKRITVCRMDLYAITQNQRSLICIGQGTYMTMAGVADAEVYAARMGQPSSAAP